MYIQGLSVVRDASHRHVILFKRMHVLVYTCTVCINVHVYILHVHIYVQYLLPTTPSPPPHSYTGYHIKLKGAPGSRERSDEKVYGGAHGHRAGPHGSETSATDAG